MKKLVFLFFLFLVIPQHNAFPIFQPIQELDSVQMRSVCISPFDPRFIYIASVNSLYESTDSGQSFRKVGVFKDEEVHDVFSDPDLAGRVYVVTSRHFYAFQENLSQLFQISDEEVIYSAAKSKGRFFIGSSKGLYSADTGLLAWRKLKKINEAIYCIEPAGEKVYLAAEGGLYSLDLDNKIERLFVMRKDSKESESEDPGFLAKTILVDSNDKDRLWLGTNNGLFLSEDGGVSWIKLYVDGIDSLSINSLAQTSLESNTIYIGATKGFYVFDFEQTSVKQIFEGLYSSNIYDIVFNPRGKIYLATAKGLFSNNYFSSSRNKESKELLKEPSIQEVQQAALYYNEVHPDKIRKWRSALKYRALFPSVSFDYDKTIYGSTSKEFFYVGPQDWGINFKWDMGDLIWNTYEDDIDTRSRLDTQLRLDVLDEINRVYFERKRLKREISVVALSKEDAFKKELRLQELTAMIDGYTGGYFSRRIKELNEKK